MDLVTALPLIVTWGWGTFWANHDLWIPYFLRAWLITTRLDAILQSDSKIIAKLNITMLTEKLITLMGFLLCILYSSLCFFQFMEQQFGRQYYSTIECLYFVLVSVSTIGYGDISPNTIQSKIVIILMIVVLLAVVPRLLNEISETMTAQRAGGGRYLVRGDVDFNIIVGHFEDQHTWLFLLNQMLDKVLDPLVKPRNKHSKQ